LERKKNKNEMNVFASCIFSFLFPSSSHIFLRPSFLHIIYPFSLFSSLLSRGKICFFAAFYKLQDFSRPSHYLVAKANSLRVSILAINSLRCGKTTVHLSYLNFTVLISRNNQQDATL